VVTSRALVYRVRERVVDKRTSDNLRRGSILDAKRTIYLTLRQKEHARQQKQRAKAERRSQRRLGGSDVSPQDELQELREHAEAQAAMFRVGPATAEAGTAGSTEINDPCIDGKSSG